MKSPEQLAFFETNDLERALVGSGYTTLIGTDEAGRGPLAGPVVAGAAILPGKHSLENLTDSKLLSEKQRHVLAREITASALAWGVAFVHPAEIDSINILQASLQAMSEAVRRAEKTLQADLILIDGNKTLPLARDQRAIVKGDRLCPSISAASILAKVARDAYMVWLDGVYPGYGFRRHKGYPTKAHRQAIERLGPTPIHRKTFRGVREFLG